MSIFKFYTEKILDSSPKNIGDVKTLSYILMAPVEVQNVLIEFGSSAMIELEKVEQKKKGLAHPVVKWLNENPVTMENDYEVDGWPLYMAFNEIHDKITIKRNPQLEDFYRKAHTLTRGVDKLLMHVEHKFSARLYAYWLLNGCVEEIEMVLTDLQEVFGVNPANYYSYSLVEKRILTRVKEKFSFMGITLSYEKDPPNYAKKLFIRISKK